jgi:hypothetical protein
MSRQASEPPTKPQHGMYPRHDTKAATASTMTAPNARRLIIARRDSIAISSLANV